MNARVKPTMTVDEFLAWAEDRPGRYELVEGEAFAMAPERTRHAETKGAVHVALLQAIRSAGVPCRVLPDGMTVRISERAAYEPDALVYCGERLDGDAIEVPGPLIVVEVLSPGTAGHHTGTKLAGYFQVANIAHYLIVDPVRGRIIHIAGQARSSSWGSRARARCGWSRRGSISPSRRCSGPREPSCARGKVKLSFMIANG